MSNMNSSSSAPSLVPMENIAIMLPPLGGPSWMTHPTSSLPGSPSTIFYYPGGLSPVLVAHNVNFSILHHTVPVLGFPVTGYESCYTQEWVTSNGANDPSNNGFRKQFETSESESHDTGNGPSSASPPTSPSSYCDNKFSGGFSSSSPISGSPEAINDSTFTFPTEEPGPINMNEVLNKYEQAKKPKDNKGVAMRPPCPISIDQGPKIIKSKGRKLVKRGARKVGCKPFCGFCYKNGELVSFYRSHSTKDENGLTECPVLRHFKCPKCEATGDLAHTIGYCPELPDSDPRTHRLRNYCFRNSRGIIGRYHYNYD